MKHLIFVLLVIALIVPVLNAQTEGTDGPKVIIIEKEETLTQPASRIVMNMNMPQAMAPQDPNAPYFGIFVEDMTFPIAQRLGYDQTYGILITGVVPSSPAWEVRLQEDDVITEINGKQIINKEEFDKIRKTLRAGDTINLKYWREGTVTEIPILLGSREKPGSTEDVKSKPKKLSPGYGGGTWIPMWFDQDMTDVNKLMTDLGFRPYNDRGILMQGFGGKGNIGKGFFLGGQIVSFEDKKKITDNTDPADPYQLWMKYNLSVLGFTVDKRIPITRGLVTSVGVVLGGGTQEIEIIRNKDLYQWPTSPADISQGNYNAKLHRGYLMVQPRAEVLVRLLSWFGLRAEGGYTYGYAPYKGWRMVGMNDDMIEIQNSPETKLEGYNITIGPWFGF
ncbi:MAG: PDZ domain-containing protein [Candidatus Cloacimonadaceae bacterium]|nr:PDZ domain-containing protein [Candidatus Cloacimonadaceae bacterium]